MGGWGSESFDFCRFLADHHPSRKATHTRSHAPRGNAFFDAPRRGLRPRLGDAERPGLHSHAERGNEGKPPPSPAVAGVEPARPSLPPRRVVRHGRETLPQHVSSLY